MAVLILLGVIARLRQYLERTSFWQDEAFILMNLRHKSLASLMGKLQYDQAAAPLYLWSLQAARHLFGESELSLRLVPLAVSLLGLPIFAILARRLLPWPAALLSLALFCLARRLIEYSAQVKQYSCDATLAALILLGALGSPRLAPERRLLLTAGIACVAVWFSHPVAIVFGGVSLALTVSCLRRGRRASVVALLANLLFATSFLSLYLLSIRPQHTEFLYLFWRSGFPDWHHPASFPAWLTRQVFQFLEAPFRWPGRVFAVLVVCSIAWARRRREQERWLACALPIGLTLLAACAGQYPFDGSRLSLFLMPELFLLIGAGSAWALQAMPQRWRVMWWALPIAFITTGVIQDAGRFLHPVYASHIRPAVDYVQRHRRPGDALVLSGEHVGDIPQSPFNGRHVEALCYWPDPAPPVYQVMNSATDIREKRFWALMAFNPGDPHGLDPILDQFRAIASEEDHFIDSHGGAAYLFVRPAHP